MWVASYLQIPLKLESRLGACIREGVLGFDTGVDLRLTAPGTIKNKSFAKPVSSGQALLEGDVTLAVEPKLQLLLYDVAGSSISIEGRVKAKTDLPATSVNITSPQPKNFNQSEAVVLEASIKTIALPEIQFSRKLGVNFEPISASELLFPPYTVEILPGFCVNNPMSAIGIGKSRYCVDPVTISFDLSGWLRGITRVNAWSDPQPPKPYQAIGKIALPELKGASLGCPRIAWETVTENPEKNQGFNLAIDETSKERALEAVKNANSEVISRSVTLPPGSLPSGEHTIRAKAYSPFILNEKEIKPLAESKPVIIKIE